MRKTIYMGSNLIQACKTIHTRGWFKYGVLHKTIYIRLQIQDVSRERAGLHGGHILPQVQFILIVRGLLASGLSFAVYLVQTFDTFGETVEGMAGNVGQG